MRYFKQGEHDGLCGLYAVINSLRYLQQAAGHEYLLDRDALFFDEAVECLARVPGVDIRVLKSNSLIGGIDQFQIRDLCRIFAERIDLDITIDLVGPRQQMPFAQRYRALWQYGRAFAVIAAHRGGTHWVGAAGHQADTYRLIDGGRSRAVRFNSARGPKLATDAAVVLTLR